MFAFGIFVLAGCSMSADTQLAESQVPNFHSSFNSGDFKGVYTFAADDLKQATSEADFVALLEAVHRKLGTMESTTRETWHVNYHTSGTLVTLAYKSNYQHGEATETFVYRLKDGSAKLAGYHVNSNALITR
ncbi:DUF4019 domain-containing protein [Aquabacterium fontiphilum]|uniref:DUF4019 domain-containing protein n=1 Tax=Aquabacterium fontiphilum TaxID=450365 RepID=UPI00137656CA|nr:DUF4019 domain-containing protein [Aquabacterium fontiphilum]NBD19790.1 DUF4019 domain-containing protein [Aquabacterium fontiphilum]